MRCSSTIARRLPGYMNAEHRLASPRMACQSPGRHPCRNRRRARLDPGGHRLLDHRRSRPARRPLCFFLHRGDHRFGRRPARDDLGRHRGHRRPRRSTHPRARPRLPVRGHDPDGRASAARGLPAPRLVDAICLALGGHRLRQRARHPHLHRPAAPADRRHLGDLRHGRRRPRHNLPPASADEGGALPPRCDRRAHDRHPLCGPQRQHGRRHGQASVVPA